LRLTTKLGTARSLLLGYCLLLASCDLFVSAREHLDRADTLLAQGNYGRAAVEVRNALADAPHDARAQLLLARVSLQLGELDGAAHALESAAAAGVPAADLAGLNTELLLRRGQYQKLLDHLDGHVWPLSQAASQLLRVQALGGLNRCVEAMALARTQSAPVPGSIRVVVAECYARGGNLARAITELKSATADQPDDAAAWVALGRLQRLSGDVHAAEASWTNAEKYAAGKMSVPQQAVMYASLADLQIGRGDTRAARQTHQKMLGIAPQAAPTELLSARLDLLAGNANGSVNTLRQLATRAPDAPGIKVLLASAYLAQRNFEQARQQMSQLEHGGMKEMQAAIAATDELSKLPKDSEDYWLCVANAQLALGQVDAARTVLTEAQKLAPESPRPGVALALTFLHAGQVEETLRVITPIAVKNPDDAGIQSVYGQALQAARRYPEAAEIFAGLQKRAPTRGGAIAEFRARKSGSLEHATQPLQDWLGSHPGDVMVRALYAEELRLADQRDQAIIEYEAVLRAAPESALAMNNLAWLYHLAGDKRALAMARRAWEHSPNTPSIADTYGWLLVESGSVNEGLPILEVADSAAGLAQPDIRFHYAVALDRAGKRQQAVNSLRNLLSDAPEFRDHAEAARLLNSLQQTAAT
jgi:predicted Zn-dependent protease